jgi:UDP-N-acetylmuramoyl-L-alanine---L-glutamate ligase
MNRLSTLVGKRLVVWGAGLDGQAAVERFVAQNEVTLVVDDPETNVPAQELAARFGVPLSGPLPEILGGVNLIVRAPGVSRYRPEVLAAAAVGVPSSNLAALWMADDHAGCIIGVTGTKGKSTTSHLTALLLRAAGHHTNLGGNIGVPVLEMDESAAFHVVEISSYMAADMERSPDIGVLTNLGEDHLPWHGSIERYQADKLNLFAHDRLRHLVVSGADAPAVAATDHVSIRLICGTAAPTPTAGLTAQATGAAGSNPHPAGDPSRSPDDQVATSDDSAPGTQIEPEPWVAGTGGATSGTRVVDLVGTPLARSHFALDLCAALTAAELATGAPIPMTAIEQVVAGYRTLPSRLEPVATIDGVEYIDDALASNPFGTCAALDAYPDRDVVLLLGGADRGVDLSPLVATIRARHAPVGIVLFSHTTARFAAALREAGLPFETSPGDDVADAVAVARGMATPGGVVLFSPAVPTPARLGNYADRSRAFKAAVAALR